MPMRVRPYGEEPWHRLKKGQVILNWGRGIFKNAPSPIQNRVSPLAMPRKVC